MKRLPAPKNQHKLIARMWEETDWNDNFGKAMTVFMTLFAIGSFAVPMGSLVSVYWYLTLAPAFLPGLSLALYLRHSVTNEGNRLYGGSEELYSEALSAYRLIYDPSTKLDALPLLQRVYDHQCALTDANRSHKSCADCKERISLITEFGEHQSLPTIDKDDLEAARATLEERNLMKELMK